MSVKRIKDYISYVTVSSVFISYCTEKENNYPRVNGRVPTQVALFTKSQTAGNYTLVTRKMHTLAEERLWRLFSNMKCLMAILKIIFLFRWFHEKRLTRFCNAGRFNFKFAFRFTKSLRFKQIFMEKRL